VLCSIAAVIFFGSSSKNVGALEYLSVCDPASDDFGSVFDHLDPVVHMQKGQLHAPLELWPSEKFDIENFAVVAYVAVNFGAELKLERA
jgi:hypothetical protein